LRAAGIKPGDEVIVPCFTFFASASSIALVGARPVFVDIDPVTYSLDPDAVRAAITNKTRAIMPVHLFTQMADMTALRQISNQTGIPLIEDSAEAIGMWFDGLHAGLFGAGGVLSFFPTKTLGALGDAGMILTQDQAIAEKCRIMRDHGRTTVVVDKVLIASDEASISGTNSKMDEIQAAILLTRLERIDQDIARRAHLARLYDDRLAHLAPRVTTPKIARREVVANPVYYVYLIEADRKDELAAYLKANGIGTEAYYPIPLHLQPCFKYLGYRQGDFPNAERACKRTLGLPFYPDLSDSDIQYVCETIGKFYAQEGQS
jgi:dTDP-4-amino-4,6-dideoxygalactose transaminase